MSRPRSPRSPIWTHPAPGQRKPKLTRELIAETAIRVADTEGFEAVSMRRVADELGAGTMTLYHYVRTKEDLVALMDDTLMGSVLVPADELPTQWRKALHVIAMSSYRSFMRHPWCLDALRGARFGPNGMRHFEQSLKAVSTAPFDLQGKLDALGIVDDYVFGHVLRVVENVDQKDFAEGRPSKAVVKYTEQMLATGEFPHIEALLLKGEAPGAAWGRIARFMNDPERFVRGLDALLDGLEARARRSR